MSVVSIHGGVEIVTPGPDDAVVAELEKLLEMARSGELVGFATGFVNRDLSTSSAQVGTRTRGLIGILEILKWDMVHQIIHEQ